MKSKLTNTKFVHKLKKRRLNNQQTISSYWMNKITFDQQKNLITLVSMISFQHYLYRKSINSCHHPNHVS
jgi:hypothetical protein